MRYPACFSFSVCLVARVAYACEPLVTKKIGLAAKVGRAATSQTEYYDDLANTMVAQLVQDKDEARDIDAPLPAAAATAAQMASRLVTTQDAGNDGQDDTGTDGTDASTDAQHQAKSFT